MTDKPSRERELLILGALLGQQLEKYRRDKWKRKIKDALWPLI